MIMRYDNRILFQEHEAYFDSLTSGDVEEPPADLFETEEEYDAEFLRREDWRFKGLWEESYDECDNL
jgi:hypothetical protein